VNGGVEPERDVLVWSAGHEQRRVFSVERGEKTRGCLSRQQKGMASCGRDVAPHGR
jgi:hypothetical protein